MDRIARSGRPKMEETSPHLIKLPRFHSMSQGVSGAGRDYGRRRRWLAQLPEGTSPSEPPVRRPRPVTAENPPAVQVSSTEAVSSILPRPFWGLVLCVAAILGSWTTIVAGGVWLDLSGEEPWRGILGLQAGRLVRFYTTVSLLACAQFSFLILWRRSRSRKDFAGRYRVWFWIGLVCSVFSVASATRFHESWSQRMTAGLNLAWLDLPVLCWMVPATTLLVTTTYLLRRDLLPGSASARWILASQWLAAVAGMGQLLGSLFIPAIWVTATQSALGGLWPAVLLSGLVTYARHVTYISNEVHKERPVVRTSRWLTKVREFSHLVHELAREEWAAYRTRREAQPQNAEVIETSTAQEPSVTKPARRPRSEASERTTAPLRKLAESSHALIDSETTGSIQDEEIASPLVHPPQPIPAPHFPITSESDDELGERNDREISARKSDSKKDRKKAKRV